MKGGFVMEINPIRTDEDYNSALQEIYSLFVCTQRLSGEESLR